MLSSVWRLLLYRMQAFLQLHTAELILIPVHLIGLVRVRDDSALFEGYNGPTRPNIGPTFPPILHHIIDLIRMLLPQLLYRPFKQLHLLLPGLDNFVHI